MPNTYCHRPKGRTEKKYTLFVSFFPHRLCDDGHNAISHVFFLLSLRSCAPIFLPIVCVKYQRIKCEQTNREMCQQPWLANRHTHTFSDNIVNSDDSEEQKKEKRKKTINVIQTQNERHTKCACSAQGMRAP